MAEEEDWGSDSSEDEDYVPIAPSDDDSDLDPNDLVPEDDLDFQQDKKKKKPKKKNDAPRLRKGGIKLSDDEEESENTEDEEKHKETLAEQIEMEQKEKSEEIKKKKADDLWASFMADVGPPARPKPSPQPQKCSTSNKVPTITKTNPMIKTAGSKVSSTSNGAQKTVTLTKEFDFAGETVKVTKEVAADSKEAKKVNEEEGVAEKKSMSMAFPGLKRSGSGLTSVLGKINKKPKMSTLEKSKLDWQSFKSKEGISEELDQHNKGKQGFLERKAFLERADQRQFEIEKDFRLRTGKR